MSIRNLPIEKDARVVLHLDKDIWKAFVDFCMADGCDVDEAVEIMMEGSNFVMESKPDNPTHQRKRNGSLRKM